MSSKKPTAPQVALAGKPVIADDVSPVQTGELDKLWGNVPEAHRHFTPRFLLNGFPKSGLHLVSNMVRPIADPMIPGQFHGLPWVGTFTGNSWTTNWAALELVLYRISRLQPGYYLKSHIGYKDEIERFLWYSGVAHIFIFRDLRDVAVSQAHHVLSDKEGWAHPDKALYKAMDGFDDVLEAVIVGTEKYPGVLERWELYVPWLKCPWVLKMRFDDLIENRADCAGRILRYGVERTAAIVGFAVEEPGPLFDELREEMAEASRDVKFSPTFREGKTGGWKTVFTERHKQLFKETDKKDELIRLGFAENNDW